MLCFLARGSYRLYSSENGKRKVLESSIEGKESEGGMRRGRGEREKEREREREGRLERREEIVARGRE